MTDQELLDAVTIVYNKKAKEIGLSLPVFHLISKDSVGTTWLETVHVVENGTRLTAGTNVSEARKSPEYCGKLHATWMLAHANRHKE